MLWAACKYTLREFRPPHSDFIGSFFGRLSYFYGLFTAGTLRAPGIAFSVPFRRERFAPSDP